MRTVIPGSLLNAQGCIPASLLFEALTLSASKAVKLLSYMNVRFLYVIKIKRFHKKPPGGKPEGIKKIELVVKGIWD